MKGHKKWITSLSCEPLHADPTCTRLATGTYMVVVVSTDIYSICGGGISGSSCCISRRAGISIGSGRRSTRGSGGGNRWCYLVWNSVAVTYCWYSTVAYFHNSNIFHSNIFFALQYCDGKIYHI